MEIFDGHRALFRPLSQPAIAVGNFDGVHVGHQALLDEAVQAAAKLGGDSAVYTFEPHPAKILNPELAPALITSRDRKLELFGDTGIDVCILEPFDLELAQVPHDTFLNTVFGDILQPRCIIVGYDFSYGYKRAGTTQTLRDFGAERGIDVRVIQPVSVDGLVASSTKVRNFINSGNMPGARVVLGRDYDVDGIVIRGAGRGRSIGVPTANIKTDAELLPPGGVYAVQLQILDSEDRSARHGGAANLGTNPTFVEDGAMSLEVHILDFDQDIYDRPVRVSFVERLRGERRFDGVDALVTQIRADVDRAREILAPVRES